MPPSTDELAFLKKPKSSREEAAMEARSKREAELQEMRRLRAEAAAAEGGNVNWDNGVAPIADLDVWRANQKQQTEEARRKKMEAEQNLHGFRGKDMVTGVKKKEVQSERTWRETTDASSLKTKWSEIETVASIEQQQQQQQQEESAAAEEGVVEEEAVQVVTEQLAETTVVGDEQSTLPTEEETDAVETEQTPPEEEETPAVQEEEEVVPEPEPEAELPKGPPTYSRVDVKFSFGLIVRSNHSNNGGFDDKKENLRDNETLKKCMSSTSKILRDQMPLPPTMPEEGDDYSSFPQAFYDPSLEPSVISIEEDTKNEEHVEKGNKRTLVKASFPVFLMEVATVGEDGKKHSSRMLKETKSTVFGALRAAVSGGSFLR